MYIQSITVTYETGGDTPVTERVATPTFSVAGGNYTEAQSVEISCETAGASIYYTLDGTEPSAESTPYDGAITISQNTTLKAIAVKDGMDDSYVATATYTFPMIVTELAKANGLAAGTEFVYNGYAVVTYVNGNDMWVRDADGNGGYFYSGISGFSKGDVLKSGWSAKVAEFKGLKEFTNATGLEKNSSAEVTPAELNISEITNDDISKYVSLENVTADDLADVQWYDKFNTGLTLEAGKSYNVTGIVGYYNKLQFYPITVEEVDAPITELAVTLDPAEKSATAGETIDVTVTANTEAEVIYEYTVTPATATVTETATGFSITSATAGTYTVSVYATDGTLEKTVEGTYTFEEPAAPLASEFVLVTNINQLAAGKQIVIADKNTNTTASALSSNQKANNRGVANITIENLTITATDAIEILTLEKEGDYWYLKANKSASKGYLFAPGGGNYLRTSETKVDNAQATITINENNQASVVFNTNADQKNLRYNSGSDVYSCYKSGQSPIYIYVEKGDEPAPELTVALEPAEKAYTVGQEAKVMVNVENGNENTMVTYKINGGADQDYDAATGIVLPNNKAMEYTVEVYATDGEREATATGTYSFTAAPAFDVTLTPNKEGNYTVGDEAVVTVAVDKYIGEEYIVTYTIGDSEVQIEYNAETGIVLPNDKAGDVTVKVYVTDGYDHEEKEYAATYHFDAAPAIVVTLTPASGNYYIGEQVTVTVAAENTIGDYDVTYKIGDGDELNYEDGIIITSEQEGTVNLTVTVADGYHDGVATASGAYTFAPRPVVAMPTFSLVAGSYTGEQTLTINCETQGATISYSTDGGNTWTTGNTVTLTEDCTVMAKAVKDGMTESAVATAAYIIDNPAELPTIDPIKGYYSIKNNGNGKYANVAGRKTLNFTADVDQKAGTVIYVETNDKGQVQSLRSQAADLQGYADRAMRYVPEIVKIVAEKLHAEGDGQILGDEGLDAIMEKFNESFDHHLYVEQAEGGYRLYGKTPSMQPVVDFYREHTHQVETKLPMLEGFINSALKKLRDKIGGNSVFTDFSLHQIWEKMGSTLTEPVDDATTMAFYREVLNNKNYVWDFAYQTAMIYLNNVKSHPRWSEVEAQMGEYAQYIDMIEQVRPDFKYYIVQQNDKPDFISQGNKDIINNDGRTLWTLEHRAEFMVNFPEANLVNGKYVTTLYTDFAYDLPEGVTAYIVTKVNTFGEAETTALEGTVPAQTPVLLKADAAGVKALTITTSNAKAPAENLLVGADYFIKQYGINTPEVEGLFDMVKEYLGESFYNSYMTQYEHLMLKTAGTVNNKYLWGLSNDDLNKCIYGEDGDCEVRTLSTGDNGVGFYMTWTAPANQAFLASKEYNPVKLALRGDVDRDGDVDINDVTALIDILLGIDTPEDNYDYEAADFDMDGKRNIDDVTSMIDYLLGKKVIE